MKISSKRSVIRSATGSSLFLAVTLGVFVACGGASNSGPATQETADQPAASASVIASAAPVASTAPVETPKFTIESQREAFVSSCMGQPGASAAHCDCGWGVFREFCSDDKLTSNSCEFDKNELRKRVTDKCASKQTPEERKTAFIAACVDSNDQKKDYCTCSWEAVKAKVIAIKTADDEEKMQPVVAKLAAEKCSAKMPIAVVKQDALGGCLKAGGKEDLCKCRIDALLKAVPMKALLSNDTKAIQAAGPSLAKCDAKKP